MATSPPVSGYRFGSFALHVRSGQLTRNGQRVRLQEKPCNLLIALMEHPGEVVTRTELREKLWPEDTFVDFEDGLNTAMRKLREALGDDPQCPRYIETVRGRGYRLLTEVEPLADSGAHREDAATSGSVATGENPSEGTGAAGPMRGGPERARAGAGIAAVLAVCAVIGIGLGLWHWLADGRPVLSSGKNAPLLIADFDNQTGDPRFDRALETAFTVGLQQSHRLTVYSRLQTEAALRLMRLKDDEPITAAVGREICQRENLHALLVPGITRAGNEYRLTAQLVDPATGEAVRSYAESAGNPDHILDALDAMSSEIRRDLGESRYEIHENHRPLPQVTTSSMQALEDYTAASDLFGKGRIADANRMYHAAITADPGFAMAWAGLGYLDYSFFVNRPDLGEKAFRTALSLSGRTTEREHAWIDMRYAESQGRIDDALHLYRLFLQRFPGDWAAEYSYARLLRMHGHAEQAVPIYQTLIRQQPDNPATWIELASADSELLQPGAAIEAYQKAFALSPATMLRPNINNEYGFALVEAGDDAKAAQTFSALLGNSRTYPYGERSLALLDFYHGQLKSARSRFMLALKVSQDPFAVARIHYWLAAIAHYQGFRSEEIAQLDQAMAELDALGPKVEYGALLGEAYASAGDVQKAREILNRIAPIANDRIEDQAAYLALLKAAIAAATGDPRTAIGFLKPPSQQDTSSPSDLVRETLAHVYESLGNRDAAIFWYTEFLRRGVPNWEPQRYWFDAEFSLAQDCYQAGDRAQALSALSQLLDSWKNADTGTPLIARSQLLRAQLVRKPPQPH